MPETEDLEPSGDGNDFKCLCFEKSKILVIQLCMIVLELHHGDYTSVLLVDSYSVSVLCL